METKIIDSIDTSCLSDLADVSDRYFEHLYCKEIEGKEITDQRVSFHTNRICMLSLAENHPIMKEKKPIKRINFEIDDKIDRLKNSASGKGKKGAQKLAPDSIICYVETETESYPVYSCIKGKLIEINEKLIENPNLLVEKPVNEGYIALLLPVLSLYSTFKESMLSKEKYLAL
ncbi:PREDICTED: protein Simiate [Nicrophorus vespilloides]|uniref:Protein Abitram n=1 Tax=Nicrophorus vespilloides TaxID=110193 RepID=A0ABM1M2Q8_NICVS|nr:PREDICTED: protein Simiate [Nicrophorus vespilloides]